ncbi:ovostatin-like [Phyllobates terribilis]|uniref:ovostatin-like n=1 Tax=Phyllobates terribilis TaxID=111132 RepID=UPI003CCAFCE7
MQIRELLPHVSAYKAELQRAWQLSATMGRLLLCAALLSLVIGARGDPQYVLSTPAMLVSGDTVKACINIVGSIEPLDVSVVLEHVGRNYTIIAEDTDSPMYFKCGDLKVPTVSSAVPVAMIFSATGSKTNLRERKSVVINSASTSCMYQMDKPTYKPGQNVHFRLICLDAQLKPVNQKFSSIYLQDPSRTKIAQWLQPELNHGVVSLDFKLISDAPLGSYVLTAERESDYPLSQWITVEQYVLPRFKLDVASPQTISLMEDSVTVNASAFYTYGEPVPGSITVLYCTQPQYYGRQRNCFSEKGETCSTMTGELGSDGSYSGVIDLYSSVMKSTRGRSFNLKVTLTEAATDIQVTESRYIWVTGQPISVRFVYESMNQYYKRGIDYPVVAQLMDESDQPIAGQEIEIQVENGEPAKVITDSDGRVVYGIDTSKMVLANFTVRVSYTNPNQCYFAEWSDRNYPFAEYTVYRFYSYSGSFLQMAHPRGELACGQSHSIDVSYIISPEGTEAGVTIYYLVLSKSVVVQNGQKDIDLSSAKSGSFSLDVMVSPDMAPSADLIVYSISPTEMIADTISLNIEKCFKNQVSMAFSTEKGTPGSTVDVQLSADPNSFCALRVIDSSFLILNPYEQFSADRVFNSRSYYYYGYNVAGFDVEDPAPPCEDPDKLIFHNGRYYLPVSSSSEGDTYSKLKSVGLLVGTSVRLRKPEVCDNNPAPQNIVPLAEKMAGVADAKFAALDASPRGSAAPIESVRTDFSETFMWLMVPIDTEGHAILSETVPDTITKWQGTAFCTSEETGFGMTKYSANYTTFLPFFVELSLPYSFIRGETLVLNGVVRNYMEQCVKVQVTLENTNAFTAELKDGQQDACICANGRASYTWEVQSNIIGELSFTVSAQTTHIGNTCDGPNDPDQPPRKDTVVQTVIVEPEGIYQEHTSSNLVFVKNDAPVSLPIQITLPESMVPDSAKAYVTAVGDIFGVPLRSLQDLVQKPYGCGEQNLARMAPIPPVLDYLNSTGQLTNEILQQAKGYMSEGYYRQLSFTSGGAYRLFPNSIETVNSMLTAYSFKTFEEAKQYIYIDEGRQQQTLIWLENSQRLDNGCFKCQGRPFTVQDSETDRHLHYTAYLASALLDSDYSLGSTLLTGALECLKNASTSEQKIYDQAIMHYVFTKANLPEYSQPLFNSLMNKAKVEGGTIHWEREDAPARKAVPFFLPPYGSPELEVTAYMLLSMAASPVTQESLTKMAQIAMWLSRQQNSHGGFVSSWDTVLVIRALAAFAKLLYVPNSQQTVVVQKGNGNVATFNLNKDNRLVVQRETLPDPNGDYVIDISGNGWCMIQSTAGYNIPVPKENAAFPLSISASSDNCVNGVAYGYTLNFELSYNGAHNESNMAIVKTRMLSGYSADYSSLSKLVEDKTISKYEVSPKEVLLYLETVPKDQSILFSFKALMGQRVLNVKSSSAIVYSYYEEAENGYASYELRCIESTKE